MEHHVVYSDLSEEARQAWETVSGLPLTTYEQQRHAWDVLRAELACLSTDPEAGLHVLANEQHAAAATLYVSAAELAALRVMVAWLKANDRAGRIRDLPIYPDVAEAILSQLGQGPWHGVWHPEYLNQVKEGGSLLIHLRTDGIVLARLLEATLNRAEQLCAGWPIAARDQLLRLLCDVSCWLRAMLMAHDEETRA